MQLFGSQEKVAETTMRAPDTVTVESDPLKLKLEDSVLVRVIDDRIKQANTFFDDKKNIKKRRAINKDYLFGRQINENELKPYNARYVDNIPYEAEGTIKPIALSRLPDMIVKPGQEQEESKETAQVITDVINSDLRMRENRTVLGLSFKHLPVYFTGVIKALWDPEKGEDGDYRFKVIHPENIVMDHTASSNDPRDMDFIAEANELSIKETIMRFPEKEDELLEALNVEGKLKTGEQNDEKKMASKIKIWEVWFTWWDSATDPETGEKKWERIEGVAWKYKKVLLKKMKNPYWDWEGERRLFTYELGKKRELTEDELRKSLFGDFEPQQEDIFHNYFKDPQKPYIFLGYDQWGEMPLDETSRIEQIRFMQDNINKRGRQITEMNDRAKGKNVFSAESGLTKDDLEEFDMADPDQDIIVDGDLREVHTYIQGTPAPAGIYKEQQMERDKAFAKMGTRATTRGEREGDETATGRQILREQDFGRIDDIVEETINHAAEKMSQWTMQFIKLFYTIDHLRRLVGEDGEITFLKISRDTVEDGMEVVVSASGVDKIQAKREAFERARMKLTDPLTFFVDTNSSDPIGRTRKLMTFMLSPELYVQQFVEKRDTEGMVSALNEQPIQGSGVPTEQAAEAFGVGQQAGGGGNGIATDPIAKEGRILAFFNNYGGGGKGYT